MGYYTTYTLSIEGVMRQDGTLKEIDAAQKELLEKEIEVMGVFDEIGDLEYGYSAYAKWYDHDDDMLLLSRRFPEILFCLHGEGEESEDMWNSYYYDGKTQYCRAVITYEDFNPQKLSTIKTQYGLNGRYSYQVMNRYTLDDKRSGGSEI